MLDAVGGDGGGFRNSIGQIVGSLNLFNMFLDGVKGDVVESQGVSLLTRLQFQYGYIGDQDDKPGNGMFNNDGWLRHSWWMEMTMGMMMMIIFTRNYFNQLL